MRTTNDGLPTDRLERIRVVILVSLQCIDAQKDRFQQSAEQCGQTFHEAQASSIAQVVFDTLEEEENARGQ